MRFVDKADISVSGGKGGRGCLSFRREKFIPLGGPDGGSGGKGGNVLFMAQDDLVTLLDLRYKRKFTAPRGGHGSGRKRHGAAGKDLIINVPTGTQIFDETGSVLLADLSTHGASCVIAKGGKAGIGNAYFKTSTNQAPYKVIPEEEGETVNVHLKLKLLADAALIGLPNAGKSSLLASLTAAHPRIANYPFSSIKPSLGVITNNYQHVILADIPGLLEEAHLGKGLGHDFLSHIERCATLIHVIDATQETWIQNYEIIRKELEMYDQNLLEKEELIVMNKVDLLDTEQFKQLQLDAGKKFKHVFYTSALAKRPAKLASTQAIADIDLEFYPELERSALENVKETGKRNVTPGHTSSLDATPGDSAPKQSDHTSVAGYITSNEGSNIDLNTIEAGDAILGNKGIEELKAVLLKAKVEKIQVAAVMDGTWDPLKPAVRS